MGKLGVKCFWNPHQVPPGPLIQPPLGQKSSFSPSSPPSSILWLPCTLPLRLRCCLSASRVQPPSWLSPLCCLQCTVLSPHFSDCLELNHAPPITSHEFLKVRDDAGCLHLHHFIPLHNDWLPYVFRLDRGTGGCPSHCEGQGENWRK